VAAAGANLALMDRLRGSCNLLCQANRHAGSAQRIPWKRLPLPAGLANATEGAAAYP
jgi:hypothetical protein